jgi:hypothetical protein
MSRFDFISDDNFRKNFDSDFSELEICLSNNAHKSVLILAGSIIEAVLIDYLISLDKEDLNKDQLLKWSLNKAIDKCAELEIISQKSKNLSDVVRDYRNLIHPGRAIRTQTFPDGNDAIVAKSLVEIIIKEIKIKKQDSYGYTAEQILSKIENDSTAEVIWHHLIRKVNHQEKRNLALKNIPSRYFDIYNNLDFDQAYPWDLFLKLSRFFKLIFTELQEDVKKEVSQKFVTILCEGSEFEVQEYIESFFIAEYFKYYNQEDQKLITEHLFGYIKNRMSDKLVTSLNGISKVLSKDKLSTFIEILYDKVLYSDKKPIHDSAKKIINDEYFLSSKENQDLILELLKQKISEKHISDKTKNKGEQLISWLESWDMDFSF